MACTCSSLPDISDGTVTQPEVATVGTTASYKCNPTFSLNWPPFRTCLPDGRWSGREPTCRSECMTVLFTHDSLQHEIQRLHTIYSPQCEICVIYNCPMWILPHTMGISKIAGKPKKTLCKYYVSRNFTHTVFFWSHSPMFPGHIVPCSLVT
jgi:hypothetical protein